MALGEADGVFQGGGMKGIALVGALLEFAAHPGVEITRWRNVAGTSAGGIVASMLAVGTPVAELGDLVKGAPYPSFEDCGRGGRILGGLYHPFRYHRHAPGPGVEALL